VMLSPMGIIYFALDFFLNSPAALAEFFLFDSIIGNLALILIFSPIFMLSMDYFQYRKGLNLGKAKLPPYFSLVVYAVALVSLHLIIRFYQPYNEDNPEPVWLIITQDEQDRRATARARIWSVQRLGTIQLTNTQTKQNLSLAQVPSRVVNDIPWQGTVGNFGLSVELEEMQNRTRTSILLSDLANIEYLDLFIRSDRNFGVIDANTPINIIDQQNIQVFVGKNPPPRIEIQLYTNEPHRLQVRAVASYQLTAVLELVRANSYLNKAYAHVIREQVRTTLEM
jgi:hypothetical protein